MTAPKAHHPDHPRVILSVSEGSTTVKSVILSVSEGSTTVKSVILNEVKALLRYSNEILRRSAPQDDTA